MATEVEFLWWEGCPSWEQALAELRTEMEAEGLDPGTVAVRRISSDAEAAAAGFPGSPTIRIGGRDIVEGAGPPSLTCRIYHLRDGRVSALPDRADVREALVAR